MALKHSQQLKLSQKLLPQQILLMKLLQLPTVALEERIKEELEVNPALEEDDQKTEDEEVYDDEEIKEEELDDNGDVKEDENKSTNDVEMEDYMDAEELDSYKYEVVNKGKDDDSREFVVVEGPGLRELLEQQLGLKSLTEEEFTIGVYLIGCIDEDGYIRRELELIVDDLAFNYNLTTTVQEVEKVLKTLHEFDPAGVCARNLQECLLIQLERKTEKTREVILAIDVVKSHGRVFAKTLRENFKTSGN
jgi:RNA polymerase sigma-54 factor